MKIYYFGRHTEEQIEFDPEPGFRKDKMRMILIDYREKENVLCSTSSKYMMSMKIWIVYRKEWMPS